MVQDPLKACGHIWFKNDCKECQRVQKIMEQRFDAWSKNSEDYCAKCPEYPYFPNCDSKSVPCPYHVEMDDVF